MNPEDLLLIIDVQLDFCPGGRLAIADGDAILPVLHDVAKSFDHIILTQDWHPEGHSSFASQHPGRKPYEVVQAPYGPQTLWPDHCTQGSAGAEFHSGLAEIADRAEMILRKGFRREIDSYSAFYENDKTTPTGMAGYLRERGFRRIFLAGLAYDFCVRYSAVDAVRAGFESFVLEDACRAVNLPGTVSDTNADFAANGVQRIQTYQLPDLGA